MGTWNASLYGNDTTQDVRDTYTKYLFEKLSNQEAFEKTLEDCHDLIGDEDDEPLFWFALAETQWSVGRLTPEVKEKALEWIEKDGGVALWEDSGARSAGWKKTLETLKKKLESPMRSEKKMEALNQNLWNIGDVYAYQFNTEESKSLGRYGKYILLQKMGESPRIQSWMTSEEREKAPMIMMIHVFDKLFDHTPKLEDREGVQLLPLDETEVKTITINNFIELLKKSDYPKKYLTFLGNATVPANNIFLPSRNPLYWNLFEMTLNDRFTRFHNSKYEAISGFVYKFSE